MAMVLTDDSVRDAQQKGLVGFISATPAANAGELGLRVALSLVDIGRRIAPSILLGAPGLMWKIKQEGDKGLNRNPLFIAHFIGGEIERIRIPPHGIEKWAASAQAEGDEVEVICDDSGFVVWPEKDGSRIL